MTSVNLAISVYTGLLLLMIPTETAIAAPEIQFSFGRVQGVDKSAENTGKPYYAYYGIPFAQPPVGDLRWEAPLPFVGTGSNTVISLNSHGPACMQAAYPGRMSEDCLQLNVYTPPDIAGQPRNTQPKKKVMVFIHGGAYVIGTGEENSPSQMVTDYDVIVVVIQYRLSSFGFASTGDDNLPGNYGLMDQILSLKWVRDNIAEFGGDADDITIFGESAGASSVSLLSISPATKGLFTKGIMQSGTALARAYAINRTPMANFNLLAEEAGCMPNPLWNFPSLIPGYYKYIIKCLKSRPAEFVNILPSFMRTLDSAADLDLTQYVDFAPVVDGNIVPADPEMLLQSKDYLEKNGVLDRSYMVGCTNGEGIGLFSGAFLNAGPLEEVTKISNIATYIQSTVAMALPYGYSQAAVDMVTYEYAYPLGQNGASNIQGLVDVQTDSYFLLPSVLFAKYLAAASDKSNIFLYLFDHYPQLKNPSSPLKGSDHGIDLFYQFDKSPLDNGAGDSETTAYTLIDVPRSEPVFDVWSGALTTFAKTGDPTRVGQTGQTIRWPRYDLQNEYYMAIANNPQAKRGLASKRVALWTEFLPKLSGN